MRILMEEEPEDIDSEKVKKEMMKVKGIYKVHDLHIWSLSGGKNILSAHIYVEKCNKMVYRDLIHKVYHELERRLEKFDISHSTLQII